ncbi:DUF4835 family protein [Candidatus Symbiothrix dinenymphae]|uniref:type IX secretion system protein PorD n=1 Tax=Candidatus Symbiothrix dinenymphae TaxID=467085 RepID=UPI0006C5B5B8|nr:DUF4835 family protein [Candidatus Symbiothrix dinenymphae]GAP73355.1 hypothetical protein SAMD00024442_8_52 [Candidatus Symbiothrix dinenymphae]
MQKKHFILILLLQATIAVQAQELNARVVVSSDRIEGTNKNVFVTMEKALTQFINGTKWGAMIMGSNEKIECSFTLNILERVSDNSFKAELSVQSRRPVYNASYTTTLLNYRENIEFEYNENANIEHQQNNLSSNLEAVVSFYANLILALDFDSFSLLGGDAFYREAQHITSMAQSNMQWNGWSAFDDEKSKGTMINAYLDESMKPLRELLYTFHRNGLDEMAANPEQGRTAILTALPVLKNMKQVRSSSLVLQQLADAKLTEIVLIAEKATKDEKKTAFELLRDVYPSMSQQLAPLKK